MDTKTFPITFLSEISISAIGIIQLIQALSFIKDAPESGSWNSSASNFFSFCKDLALRFDGDAFIAIYIASCVVSFISIIVYIIFFDQIHKANKQNGAFFYLILFFEYGVFGFGFIPMISKFVEVQLCNSSLDIVSYSSVSCFQNEQLWLLEIGFFSIGIVFLMNAAIFPTLKFERNGVERLWGNESYFEGFYYLYLTGVVSLFGYIELPWVGVVVGLALFVYAMVFECFQSVFIACNRCGIVLALIWGFAAADQLDVNSGSANTMIYLWPVIYVVGFVARCLKNCLIKRSPQINSIVKINN